MEFTTFHLLIIHDMNTNYTIRFEQVEGNMSSQPKTVGVREAALKMGFTLKYLYDLIYSGKLEAVKVGRKWHIPSKGIQDRLKERAK